MAEGFKATSIAATRFSNSLGYRPNFSVVLCNYRENSVGFTEFVRSDNDAAVSVMRHFCCLPVESTKATITGLVFEYRFI